MLSTLLKSFAFVVISSPFALALGDEVSTKELSREKFFSYQELGSKLAIQFKMSSKDWETQKKELEESIEAAKKNLEVPKDLIELTKINSEKPEVPDVLDLQIYETWGSILGKVKSYRQKTGTLYPVADALNDLEFFINTDGTARKTLFNTISRTKTFFGEFVLASMLANPLTDVAAIEKRQKFLTALMARPETIKNLQSRLDKVKSLERELAKWVAAHPLYVNALAVNAGSSADGWNRFQSAMTLGGGLFNLFLMSAGSIATAVGVATAPQSEHLDEALGIAVSGAIFAGLGYLGNRQSKQQRNVLRMIHELPIKMNDLLLELTAMQL